MEGNKIPTNDDTLGFMLSKFEIKAPHPITCLNPDEWFSAVEYNQEYHPALEKDVIRVRGEKTAWFRLDQCEVRLKTQ